MLDKYLNYQNAKPRDLTSFQKKNAIKSPKKSSVKSIKKSHTKSLITEKEILPSVSKKDNTATSVDRNVFTLKKTKKKNKSVKLLTSNNFFEKNNGKYNSR